MRRILKNTEKLYEEEYYEFDLYGKKWIVLMKETISIGRKGKIFRAVSVSKGIYGKNRLTSGCLAHRSIFIRQATPEQIHRLNKCIK